MIKKTFSAMLVASALLFIGCGGEEEAPAAAATEPAAAEPAAAPSGGGGGGGVCGRAADCCAAYIEAMGGAAAGMNPDQVCMGVRQAGQAGPQGEPACTAAVNAWKQSLTQMNKPVPAACN
jgi:hypothetical protein